MHFDRGTRVYDARGAPPIIIIIIIKDIYIAQVRKGHKCAKGPHSSARGTRIVSSQATIEVDETSDYGCIFGRVNLLYCALTRRKECEGNPIICQALSLSNRAWLTVHVYMYTVSQKKQDTKLLPITSPNVNRFSKFFHW